MALTATCPECGCYFEVLPSMRGGFANCPDCGRACEVQGGIDWEFTLIVLVALAGIGVISGGLAAAGLVTSAIMTGVIGLLILAIVLLAL